VLVTHRRAAAGLQITASHNPAEWNGLKPFSAKGQIFNEEDGRRLLDILQQNTFAYRPWDRLGSAETLSDSGEHHLHKLRRRVDVDRIRERRPRVVLDCNHGSGAALGPRMLQEFGCETIALGAIPDGRFAHTPEPTRENLLGFTEELLKHRGDVGFAQDPDADRLAIVDETGRYIGEELTLALCLDHVLPKTPGAVVVNGSTSRVNEDIAGRHGCAFHRSFVGEAHVVALMQQAGAVIGGEGNGGVIDPQIGYVRDSFAGMALILEGLAERGGTLSAWVDSLPVYHILKDKLTCPKEILPRAIAAMKQTFADAVATEGDGLRLDWPDRWVQIRASNTEPIVRIIAEAPQANLSQDLIDQTRATIEPLLA
jgi:phosphomannomutase